MEISFMEHHAIGGYFEREVPIRFAHCDPAGIVFFPQYFVMFNNFIEDWFNEELEIPYADYLGWRRLGLPTVSLSCEFLRPSKFGDKVKFGLSVHKLGSRSITLHISCFVNGEERLHAEQVLVTTSLETNKAVPIPPDLLERLHAFRGDQDVPAVAQALGA
jgi:4-hydroxybenzoyl-CoA thioesterase